MSRPLERSNEQGLPKFAESGVPVAVNLGTRREPNIFRFVTGEPARMEDPKHPGFVRQSGEVRLPDKQLVYALLYFCETDSNEHYNTQLVLPNNLVDAADLIKPPWNVTRSLIFPYRYRYYVPVDSDHHVGNDGWSR